MKNSIYLTSALFSFNESDKVIQFNGSYKSGDDNQSFTIVVSKKSNGDVVPARVKQAEAVIEKLKERSDTSKPIMVVVEGRLGANVSKEGSGKHTGKHFSDLSVWAIELTPCYFE